MSSEIIDFELWKKVNSIRIKLSLRVWLTALPDLLRSLLFSRVTVESKLDSDLSAHVQNQSAHEQNQSAHLLMSKISLLMCKPCLINCKISVTPQPQSVVTLSSILI